MTTARVELKEYKCTKCGHISHLVGRGKREPFCGRGHLIAPMTLTHPEQDDTVTPQEEKNGKSRRKQ